MEHRSTKPFPTKPGCETVGDVKVTQYVPAVLPRFASSEDQDLVAPNGDTSKGTRDGIASEDAPPLRRTSALAPTVLAAAVFRGFDRPLARAACALLLLLSSACQNGTAVQAATSPVANFKMDETQDEDDDHRHGGSEELSRAQRTAIAQVKSATAKFQRLSVAQAAGFTNQFPAGCKSTSEGGQGFHYLNPARVDTLVELLRPELVMYEPQKNGRMELIGVDYVVPLDAWRHEDPPTLLGVPFMRNEALGVWALHIWNWRRNPSGTFAMWNPRVSCEFAK